TPQGKNAATRHHATASKTVSATRSRTSSARGTWSRIVTATRPGKLPEAHATPPAAVVWVKKESKGTRSARKPAPTHATGRHGTRFCGNAARVRACATGTAAASRNAYAARAATTA